MVVIVRLTLLLFQASSSCDGSVQVWSVDDQSEVKTLQVLDKCSDVRQVCNLKPIKQQVVWVLKVRESHRDEVLASLFRR